MRNEMKTPTDLPTLQKQYDRMATLAMSCLANGEMLTPKFERELTLLMRAVKSMGGKV
jgi:hypothetical protein